MPDSAHTDPTADHESRMMKAIVRDVLVAVPVSLLMVFGTILFFTDSSVGVAIAGSLLPGILIGVFFGGFFGTARTMG